MSEWSDDGEAPVARPPITKASSRNTRAEVQSKGGGGVPEQQAEKTPTAEAARPPQPRPRGLTLEQCLGARGGSADSELSIGKLMCKHLCLGIGSYPIFIW